MSYGVIYKIWNNVNDKLYIGQTIQPLQVRMARHRCTKDLRCPHLANAINKYGKDNFFIEQIDIAHNKIELNEKESYWITKFDTIKNGYNLIDRPIFHTPEKRKSSFKKFSEEKEKEIFDIYCKGHFTQQEIADKYNCSRNLIINIIKSKKDLKPMLRTSRKKVIQIDPITMGIIKEFNSISEACVSIGVGTSCLTRSMNSKREDGTDRINYGFIWRKIESPKWEAVTSSDNESIAIQEIIKKKENE